MAYIYGSVGRSTYEENKRNKELNGYSNKSEDEFFQNGPQYKKEIIEKEMEEISKQRKDNAIGSIILIIIIIVLLVIFVLPNISQGL